MADPTQSLIQVDISYGQQAVAFSMNGEHILNGGFDKVDAWRVQDGQRAARMKATGVYCLAVSKNGRWIAGGTRDGDIFLWDAGTYETVWQHKEDPWSIRAIDCSPDSTRLVCASSGCTATIWAIPNRTKVHTLPLAGSLIAARYSPDGDHIATATYQGPVRVWDSAHGRLLTKIPVTVTPDYNHGLVWFSNHIFVVSDSTIKRLDASTGSTLSEWTVPNSSIFSCIALTDNGNCIAYSTEHTVTFWDPSTQSQLGLIRHSRHIRVVALSPGGQFLAAGAEDGEIIIETLSRFTRSEILPSLQEPGASLSGDPDVQIRPAPQEPDLQTHPAAQELELQIHSAPQEPDPQIHPTFHDPVIQLNHAILDAWKNGELENANALLTIAIHESPESSHNLLAARALVRTRLDLWDDALTDADMAIDIQHSVIAYIAKSVAYIGKGDSHAAYRACDIALEHFHSHHVTSLLLIKAIIAFMAGEHLDAISRMDDLIATVPSISTCYTVQAYMYLVRGNMLVEQSNYDLAIASLRRAHARLRGPRKPPPLAISLMSGWDFDALHLRVRQRLCETLYAAHRTNDAAKSLLYMVNASNEEIYTSVPLTKWVSEFTQQCLSAGIDTDAISNATLTPLLKVWANSALASGGWKVALATAAHFTLPRIVIYSVICKRLEMINRTTDAVACFLDMTNDLEDDNYKSGPEAKWVCNFTERQLSASASKSNPSTLQDTFIPLLRAWAKAKLALNSWKDALISVAGRILPRAAVYAALCEYLIDNDHIPEAIECFGQLMSESGGEANLDPEHLEWAQGFRRRLIERQEHLGDTAVDAQRHGEAILHYTAALSLNPASLHDLLIKRSKAYLDSGAGLWKEALDDAAQAITVDPSLPWGYQMKHAASHLGGNYDSAIAAFEEMLSKMTESPNPDIQQKRDKYISPSSTRAAIQKIVQKIVPHLPRVLINVTTGQLHDRAAQAALFESSLTFKKLVSSTTTRKDYVRIKREVRQYFRYVMLSHRWEQNEPLFHQVMQIAIYDLDESPTHNKLQTFCKLVRDSGFHWAWSDTCCINKSDHFVLQEALVAMFKWYQECAMMIVFLRGIQSPPQLGALVKSIWNTRGWTLQEYIAAKVIHFYTEDWAPYLPLDIPNHKESSEVISEMEQATGVPAELLMALRPGFSGIREKLRLASTRETTLIEDAAYSLLGIFSVTGLPAIYGEGDGSLGRLLSHVLAGSGDTSILAWTGESGSFNSCLPARITVFSESATSHLPTRIPDGEITTQSLPSFKFDLDVALKLYDRLNELSTPWFSGKRMRLPCIAFELPPLSRYRTRSGRIIYRAETVFFGTLDIRTKHDLSRAPTFYLIHPWLDALLERGDRRNVTADADVVPSPSVGDEEVTDEDVTDGEEGEDNEVDDTMSLHPHELPSRPQAVPPMDGETRARRLVAHLRQPFGAILLALTSTGVREDYTRVAADSLIRVQFSEEVSLADILGNVRTLDVL